MGAVYFLHGLQQFPNAGFGSSIKIKTGSTMLLCSGFFGDKSSINNGIAPFVQMCAQVSFPLQEFLISIN